MRKAWVALGATALVATPILAAPPPAPGRDRRSVAALIETAQSSGQHGKALIDVAIAVVARAFVNHSIWHLWETPAQALAGGRGWSQQYNTVLRDVLWGLGFEARLVHAARVRGFGHPWWLAGHTWVKVTCAGEELDACASKATNRAGTRGFTPLTEELPVRAVTRWAVSAALAPFVARHVWGAWMTRRTVPTFVYSSRADDDQ